MEDLAVKRCRRLARNRMEPIIAYFRRTISFTMGMTLLRKNRIAIGFSLLIAICLVFFVYTLFSAIHRSNQVEESQLRLIVGNFQLENRIVFSHKESILQLEAKKIESGTHEVLTGKSGFAYLKNLIDVMDKVAAVGIISENGEEYAIQKRNNLYATYYYQSASDSLARVSVWDGYEKREVADSNVGNRMFHADIFRSYASQGAGKLIWRSANNLPGIAVRKGLSASILVTDTTTGKKYIVLFFVPFKRLMTNTVKVGYKQGEVFVFNRDSLYFNFDGTRDSASGFDTTKYFVSWNQIPVKQHLDALKAWQALPAGGTDSIRIVKFKTDGVTYRAGFSPIPEGQNQTYYALVVPSASLPTLLRSKTGALVMVAFILLLLAGIVFTIIYLKNFRKVRFIPLTAEAVRQMIAHGENDLLEFKSTIRANLHAGKPGKEIELAWLKSVVAFCNTEGGSILLGVKDNGEILGLEADNFQNDDKCLLHVQNLIKEHVGLEYLPYVKFTLVDMGDKKILAVQCSPLKRIMLLKSAGKEQFYVRSGPSSIELPMSKVLEYVNDRKKIF
jgi:hypothetical protein